MSRSNYISFDWAIKRLLRQKANFVVLEGFLSCLLEEKITIEAVLESEGNKETAEDKFNRVDVLVKSGKGELIIIEVQNDLKADYFQRILYGVSKVVTEYISEGQAYEQVKKVYSINIVYYNLERGEDYIYRGRTEFHGVRKGDLLPLTKAQQMRFKKSHISSIFPEYYVLYVNEFDGSTDTPLDEWMAFLKNGDIPDTSTAPGLPEARERLRRTHLSRAEQADYDRYYEDMRDHNSSVQTKLMLEQQAAEARQDLRKARQDLRKARQDLEANKAAIEAKDAAIEAKDAAIEAKDAALEAQARRIAELEKLATQTQNPTK